MKQLIKLIKVPKVVKYEISNRYYKTLGTSKQPIVPPLSGLKY